MEVRSLKIMGMMAFFTFCVVWAYLSVMHNEMYVPPASIVTGLSTLIGGRLIQTYAEGRGN